MTSVSVTSSPFFHVESPYVIRNLREALLQRQSELVRNLRNGDELRDFLLAKGRMEGIDDALRILEDMEKKESK